ncbi:MAG: single-stranded DNA-binding protein [Bacteroidetes bacterium]|nr:MAG: single-stranded DNA-binding protein [Bacteroidota bacterium]
MAGVNRVILIGNLGKDPDVITFDNGVKKASFSLATTESYKNKDGNRIDQTEWHNIVMWRGLADIAERFLRKGSQVFIEGKLRTRSWEQDGAKKYITEVFTDNMTMLGNKQRDSSEIPAEVAAQEPKINTTKVDQEVQTPQPEDDLPF